MPEHERRLPVPGGGYPPMTPLRGAVLGWPYDDALSSISTPDAARAALRAEAETSVADPVGLRRLWVRDVYGLLVLVVAVWFVVSFVRCRRAQGFAPARRPSWPFAGSSSRSSAAMPWLLAVVTRLARPGRGCCPVHPSPGCGGTSPGSASRSS